VLLSALAIALVVLLWRGVPWGSSTSTASAPPPTSNPHNGPQPRAGAPGKPTSPPMPVAVNLDKLEPVPDEPGVGRNLFRFGMRPPPPPPPPPKIVETAPIVTVPPPPPGPPPIDLQLKGITQEPNAGRIAWLKDPKAPAESKLMSGGEGQIVDGKYRILKIGTESVILSYVDGTQQRTILLSR
jgi:hypothetical protein